MPRPYPDWMPRAAAGPTLPELRVSGYRHVLGMPGPVWTMALWYAAVAVVLSLSLVVPLNARAEPAIRATLLVYALLVFASLLVMRQRTPEWYIRLQIAIAIAGALWLIYASRTQEGAVTASMALIIAATYTGFWFPVRIGLGYVIASSAGFLLALSLSENVPRLLVPWFLVSIIMVGLVLTLSSLVQQMDRQLVTDPLTGLLNRTAMFRMAERSRSLTRAGGAVVVIDLDRFKWVNDRQGHDAGDRVLSEFGVAMRDVTPAGSLAIRSGGDEFVLLLPGGDEALALALITRLREGTAVPWSFGISAWPAGEPLDLALARADKAMYEQKDSRRD